MVLSKLYRMFRGLRNIGCLSLFRLYFAWLLLLFSQPYALSQQVTGTFFPTAYGDIQTSAAPFSQEFPTDAPLLKGQATQFQQDLLQQRRPYISSVFAYANQSLVPRDSKLDTVTQGIEVGFFPTLKSQVQLFYLPTIFGLQKPQVFGNEYRAVYRVQPTDRFKLITQLGLFQYGQNATTDGGLSVIGGAAGFYSITDRIRANFGYRRDIIGNSLLSATGINLPGTNELVGRAKQDLIFVGGDFRPTPKTAISFQYGHGIITGHDIDNNNFNQCNLYAGRTIYHRDSSSLISFIQPGYQFLWLSYAKDLDGFGNLTLVPAPTPALETLRLATSQAGLTSIPMPVGSQQPGVGGYFSPQQFYVNTCRVDLGGRLLASLYYRAGAGLGVQNLKQLGNHLDQSELSGNASASVNYRFNRHINMEVGWIFLQNGTTYRRNVCYSQTRYVF